MWQAVGKFVGGKVLTAILVVASGAAMLWFWKHPEDLRAVWHAIKAALVWLGFAIALPWVSFFVLPWIRKFNNNVAPALLLLALLAIDVLVAFYLADWDIGNALAWIVLVLGFLAAAVYNFVVCNYLAARIEEAQGF